MAEKGILVTDQVGGESVALRDAFEQDNDSNARVVQRIDHAVDHIVSPMGAAIRTGVQNFDNYQVDQFPAQMTNNLIACGDKSKLVVTVEFKDQGSAQSITVVPVIYDDEVSPGVISVMEAKILVLTPADVVCRTQSGYDDVEFLAEAAVWDLCGASKVGLLVRAISGAVCGGSQPACIGASVWGFVI